MIDRLRVDMAEQPMTPYQALVVAMCVVINILDGFDILSIAFAAPAISREWSLGPAQTGLLLSSGLAGIGLGALLFSIAADIVGRRPIILLGLIIMSAGMLAAGIAPSVGWLAGARVLTGLGIGGMTSTAGTLAIEYSSARRRTFAVALVVIGYPLGATVGGFISLWLLDSFGWRSLFIAGGMATTLLFPLLWWRMPESIAFLAARQPAGALHRINIYAARMGRPPIATLPPPPSGNRQGTFRVLFSGKLLGRTFLLSSAYALFMFSFYFIINWATSLITRLGLPDAAGVSTSAFINGGGIAGGLFMGWLSARVALTRLVSAMIFLMGLATAAFGWLPPDMTVIMIASVVLGFFMWGGSAGCYSIIALCYPVTVRATGIGTVITAGRIGSILGPSTGGVLLGAGVSAGTLTLLAALPALLCALLLLKVRPIED